MKIGQFCKLFNFCKNYLLTYSFFHPVKFQIGILLLMLSIQFLSITDLQKFVVIITKVLFYSVKRVNFYLILRQKNLKDHQKPTKLQPLLVLWAQTLLSLLQLQNLLSQIKGSQCEQVTFFFKITIFLSPNWPMLDLK